MMIENFELKKKLFILARGKYDALRNHLGPPELLLGPLIPPFVPLSSPSYRNTILRYQQVTISNKIFYQSHLDTPELLLGPLNLLRGSLQS